MKKLILATSNPGKILELQTLLTSIECIPQQLLHINDADETGLSFIENAIIKARHASQLGNMPALADDSGLVVKVLKGEPGIYSARFAGPHATSHDNIQLLLKRLVDTPENNREAYFYCALAVVLSSTDPTPIIATGKFEGTISFAPQGEHGFGYDPIFFVPAYGCTAAQLSTQIKNTISHRAIALKQLLSEFRP